MSIAAAHVIPEGSVKEESEIQLDFFSDFAEEERKREAENKRIAREMNMQKALLSIKKYGKNAVLKGMNYIEGATARERNGQVGGHKA